MFLDLSQMRGERDRLQRTYAADAFEPDEDYRVVQPVTLAADVYKKNAEVTLVGHVATVLELACGRCLEPYTLAVDASFDLLYLPHTHNGGEGEIEIEDDDLNTAFYRDDAIDLGQLIREQFCLALPMKPLCREDCRGLCPQCGTNLNLSACTCVNTWVDPRLEALRGLIADKDEP